jgi:MEDS: MEthanogen/methylotroph, DcmR Sensory domain
MLRAGRRATARENLLLGARALRVGYPSLAPPEPDSSRDSDPISLAGRLLGPGRHICAFFDSRDDEYRVLLPFVKEGFDCGEKAVHIVDPRRRSEHLERLASVGIDADAARQAGQLDVRDWANAHLSGGSFDQHRMLGLIEEIRETTRKQGFPRIRFVTHMEWALEDEPGVDSLLEYEARANLVPFSDPVVCTYDLTRFSGDVVVGVIRTHPLIIIGGILHENPFFVPPDEFLRELDERRGGSSPGEHRGARHKR